MSVRSRVSSLEVQFLDFQRQINQLLVRTSLLEQNLETEKRVSKEYRDALYASYRRGFPDASGLEVLWQKVEAL